MSIFLENYTLSSYPAHNRPIHRGNMTQDWLTSLVANLGGFSRQNFACFTTRGVTQPPRDCSAVQGGAIPAGQMELDGAGGSDLPVSPTNTDPHLLLFPTKRSRRWVCPVPAPRPGPRPPERLRSCLAGLAWLLHPPKYARRKTAIGGENTTQDI